eukprot:363302-Chlamydomonas_euryale.AAC.10
MKVPAPSRCGVAHVPPRFLAVRAAPVASKSDESVGLPRPTPPHLVVQNHARQPHRLAGARVHRVAVPKRSANAKRQRGAAVACGDPWTAQALSFKATGNRGVLLSCA